MAVHPDAVSGSVAQASVFHPVNVPQARIRTSITKLQRLFVNSIMRFNLLASFKHSDGQRLTDLLKQWFNSLVFNRKNNLPQAEAKTKLRRRRKSDGSIRS